MNRENITRSNKYYEKYKPKIKWLLDLFVEFDIKGLENIPIDGPAILASNHISLIDPLAICVSLKRDVNFVAKEELYTPILKDFLLNVGTIPIKRDIEKDIYMLKQIKKDLKEDKIVGIFPEGHRNKPKKTGKILLNFKPIARLTRKGNVSLIPVGITRKIIFPKGNLKFMEYKITYGEPMNIEGLDNEVADNYLKVKVKTLMYKNKGLL